MAAELFSQSSHDDEEDPPPSGQRNMHAQQSSFANAFPNVAPAPGPSRSRESAADPEAAAPVTPFPVPEHYLAHWRRVPTPLKNVPFDMQTIPATAMTPLEEHIGRMFSEAKCLSLLPPDSVELLKGPYDGVTYCFVGKTNTEIPRHIQEVMFFFDTCAKKCQSGDRSPFVFPTKDIGLQIDRTNNKTVTGLFAKGEMRNAQMDPTVSPQSSQESTGEYISMKQILESRAHEQPEECRSPLGEIKMHLGFTGVEFTDARGETVHENFAVLMVTTPPNFFLWLYIYENMLLPPKMGSAQYSVMLEFYTTMKTLLQKIMDYELVVNLGVLHQDLGGADDYKFNPGGSLGVLTILSPFQIPLKIFKVVTTQHPGARNVQIMGMPQMTFRTNDENTAEWLALLRKSINEDQRSMAQDFERLQSYNTAKDKSAVECPQQQAVGGWPLPPIADDGTVLAFGLPPLPIMLRYKIGCKATLNPSFDVWFSSIGGADALPELVRALLRSYLVNTSTGDVFPEITHFLRDTRVADPVLLYNTYLSPSVDPFEALNVVDSQRVWWAAFSKDMHRRVEAGGSIADAVKNLDNYVLSAIQTLEGMTEAGVFRSKTISQMLDILKTLDFEEVCATGKHSIAARVREKAKHISELRAYDTVYRGWYAFVSTFSEINGSLCLNATNLMCGIELLISRMLFKFGGRNDTW